MGDFCFHDCTQFRAELDAYYVRLYGLTRDELRYTPFGVDPKEVHGEDFTGETVRVVKEKEAKQFVQEQYLKVTELKRDCLD